MSRLYNYQPSKSRLAIVTLVAFALTACGETKRSLSFIPTPPERLVCEQAGTRPTIPPEVPVVWGQMLTVPQAKAAYDAYVASVRAREGIVAGYVLKVESALFTCWSNTIWRKDFEADLAKKHPQ